MRKILTMFLMLVSVGLIFAGAVSAAAYVEVEVIDENKVPVDNATPGQEVNVWSYVDASDNGLNMPYVEITVDPENGLDFDPDKAQMTTDGINWIANDPINPFFFWYAPDQVWVWDIHRITGNMDPNEAAELIVPATVKTTGYITVNANLWQHMEVRDDLWVDNDSYTFLSLAPEPSVRAVPMQDTGAPLALAVLGLLGVAGGVVYSRIRR